MNPRTSVPVLVILAGATLMVAGIALDVTGNPRQAAVAGLTVGTIGLWATGALSEHLAALGFFVVASIAAVAPPEVIYSGFSSSALWLVLGGMIIGLAVDRTGLAAWLAGRLVGRISGGYPRIVATVVAGTVLLGFLVPSGMARAVILIPIVARLAEQLGFRDAGRGRTGLLAATAISSYLVPAAILPANLPNAMLMGAADTLYGIQLDYGSYLLTHFPVLGVLKSVVIVVAVSWLFHEVPERPRATGAPAPEAGAERLSPGGRRCLWLLLVALALWMTDSWHGVAPGWISAAVALVCLLPGIGLVPPESFHRDISVGTVLFVAGVLGVGAVVAHSGVGDLVAASTLDRLGIEPDAPARNFAVLSALGIGLGMFATFPGVVAVLTPLAEQIAAQSGLPLVTVLMTVVIGYSTAAFPYQTAPLMFALKLGNVGFADSARALLAVFVPTVALLLPLDYLWWRYLGLL